jgi:hypothetical protein
MSCKCKQLPTDQMPPAFCCPEHVLAAFDERPASDQQLYLLGKIVQLLSVPLATGGISFWVEIKARTLKFEQVGSNPILSGSACC